MLEFSSYKEACLFGYRQGFSDGLEKGIDMSEWWENENCPPNTVPMIAESVPVETPTE